MIPGAVLGWDMGAALLTCDTHFKDLPGVTLVEKIKT